MKAWLREVLASPVKKAMPILSFPSVQLTGKTVRELISSSDAQACGMKKIADRVESLASVSMMDLSVEAEAFGASVRVSEKEVPTVYGSLITSAEEAEALAPPAVGAGRTGISVEAIRKACALITDRPVFAGVIGPYSLAGRLLDVSEIMVLCYEEPETVHTVLEKVTSFLISYIEAYKATGCHGVVMAEPLAGLLNPALMREFSAPYVKRIVDATQSDDFLVIYHNCGGAVPHLTDEILSSGAAAYHFGNSVRLLDMLEKMPRDVPILGNIDPVRAFVGGTPESVYAETRALLDECAAYPNFILSSGCDIPPHARWENIDAFFRAASDFYKEK